MSSQQPITVLASGKINLALNVGKTRADGFHEVDMVMQQVSVFDEVRLSVSESGSVEMVCDNETLETDESNLCVKAFRAMEKACHVPPVRIELVKRIPIAAGMAGGSTDAAAVIRGINRMFALGLSLEEECAIGAQIGSDVPFCLVGGCARCVGRGEIVRPLSAYPKCHLVLVKPSFAISTPWSYRVYKEEADNPPADIESMSEAILEGDLRGVCAAMGNQLAKAAEEAHPQIVAIRAFLEAQGAVRAMMTGSGPTVFGVFEEAAAAEKALQAVSAEFPDCRALRCETLSET